MPRGMYAESYVWSFFIHLLVLGRAEGRGAGGALLWWSRYFRGLCRGVCRGLCMVFFYPSGLGGIVVGRQFNVHTTSICISSLIICYIAQYWVH